MTVVIILPYKKTTQINRKKFEYYYTVSLVYLSPMSLSIEQIIIIIPMKLNSYFSSLKEKTGVESIEMKDEVFFSSQFIPEKSDSKIELPPYAMNSSLHNTNVKYK